MFHLPFVPHVSPISTPPLLDHHNNILGRMQPINFRFIQLHRHTTPSVLEVLPKELYSPSLSACVRPLRNRRSLALTQTGEFTQLYIVILNISPKVRHSERNAIKYYP